MNSARPIRRLNPNASAPTACLIRSACALLIEVPRAGFEWLAEGPRDWRTPWADWTRTRYEEKALREGRTPHYLTFRKR